MKTYLGYNLKKKKHTKDFWVWAISFWFQPKKATVPLNKNRVFHMLSFTHGLSWAAPTILPNESSSKLSLLKIMFLYHFYTDKSIHFFAVSWIILGKTLQLESCLSNYSFRSPDVFYFPFAWRHTLIMTTGIPASQIYFHWAEKTSTVFRRSQCIFHSS